MNGRWQTSLLPKARALENPHLKLDALGVVAEDQPGVLHESGEGDSASDRRLEAGVIDEVDGSGLGHEVDGGDEDDEEGGAEDLDEIEVERSPEVENLVGAHSKNLDGKGDYHRDQRESYNVVDQVLVAKFDILELDGAGEIRRHGRHFEERETESSRVKLEREMEIEKFEK